MEQADPGGADRPRDIGRGAIRDAVYPLLGTAAARRARGRAPGGDVTMAIDEIAETVTEQCCREAGDIAFYSEDRGYVEIGTPRAILLIDPIDGTRPAAAGFEACCVSVAVLPPSQDATLGDVEFGVVHEIKNGQRFFATRGEGARVERADGSPAPDRAVGRTPICDPCSSRPGSAAGRRSRWRCCSRI